MMSGKRHYRMAKRRPVLYWALISFILIVATALLMLIMEVVDFDFHPWDEQRAIPSSSRASLYGVETPRLCAPGQLGAVKCEDHVGIVPDDMTVGYNHHEDFPKADPDIQLRAPVGA